MREFLPRAWLNKPQTCRPKRGRASKRHAMPKEQAMTPERHGCPAVGAGARSPPILGVTLVCTTCSQPRRRGLAPSPHPGRRPALVPLPAPPASSRQPARPLPTSRGAGSRERGTPERPGQAGASSPGTRAGRGAAAPFRGGNTHLKVRADRALARGSHSGGVYRRGRLN